MDREGGYAGRAHLLYEMTLKALAEGQTYDCFVIMLERSKCVTEWKLSGQENDRETVLAAMRETQDVAARIGERMLELHGRMQQLMQMSTARLAYARQIR